MTTREMAKRYRICEMCDGWGRIDHGGVDATCPRPEWGGCHGTGLAFCPECGRGHIHLGHTLCDVCEATTPAA